MNNNNNDRLTTAASSHKKSIYQNNIRFQNSIKQQCNEMLKYKHTYERYVLMYFNTQKKIEYNITHRD